MNCREASFLLSQARDRALPAGERLRLKLHVAMCRNCARFEAQLPLLGAIARAHAGSDIAIDEPSADGTNPDKV